MAAIDSTNYRPQTGLLAGPPGDVDYPRLNSPPPSDQPLFYHKSLNLARDNIRVLRVLPDLSSDALIQCTLDETVLADKHTCLSYIWGSKEGQRNILVNARLLRIRANLWHFLQLARHKYADRLLWIDAICIDQEDWRERGHQISLMGDIFARAKQVLVCLGGGSSEIPLGMTLIRRFKAAWLLHAAWTNSDLEWNGLVELCNLPYWRRIWIKQEILNADDAILLWGDCCCAWEELADLLGGMTHFKFINSPGNRNRKHRLRNILDTPALPLAKFYLSRLPRDRDRKEAPIILIPHFCFSDCKNTRDRVYGLLGLTILDGKFPVDYQCSLTNLLLLLLVYCRDFQYLDFHSFDPRYSLGLDQLLPFGIAIAMALGLQEIDFNDREIEDTLIGRSATSRLKDCFIQDRLPIWSRCVRADGDRTLWRTQCQLDSLARESPICERPFWSSRLVSPTRVQHHFREGDTLISSGYPPVLLLHRSSDQMSKNSGAIAWVVDLGFGRDNPSQEHKELQILDCEGTDQIRFEHSHAPYPHIRASRNFNSSPLRHQVPITLPMSVVVHLNAALIVFHTAKKTEPPADQSLKSPKVPTFLDQYRPSASHKAQCRDQDQVFRVGHSIR